MGTIVSSKKWSDEDDSSVSAAVRARVRFAAARYMSNVQKQRECQVNDKQPKEGSSRMMAEGGQKWMKDPGVSKEEIQHALACIPKRREEDFEPADSTAQSERPSTQLLLEQPYLPSFDFKASLVSDTKDGRLQTQEESNDPAKDGEKSEESPDSLSSLPTVEDVAGVKSSLVEYKSCELNTSKALKRHVSSCVSLQSVDLQGDANPTENQLQPVPENANSNQEETHGETQSKASLQMVSMDEVEEESQDSLTRLLYEEIAEDGLVSKLEKVTEEEPEESGSGLPSFHQSLRKEIQARLKNPPDTHEHSILIAPPSKKTILKAAEFRGGVVNKLKHLPSALKFEYHQFMTDVEQTTFYARQQIETGLMDYTPQKVLLISSSVPKAMMLKEAARKDVHCHVYDFAQGTFQDIHDTVKSMLSSYKEGAKAKYLGIVCKGGPGYLYLLHKVPVTSVKLRKNKELLDFWKTLGGNMSKLFPGESVIHLMESNVAGNKQGEKLLEDLEIAMYSHQLKVQSPIELAPSGRNMISLYFDPVKHKLWKSERYTKFQLYK